MMNEGELLEVSGKPTNVPNSSRTEKNPAAAVLAGGTPTTRREAAARPVPAGQAPSRLVVAIPTANRPAILPDTVRAIAEQDRLPDLMILSLANAGDIGDLDPEALPFPTKVVMGRKGATAQRNRVLDELRPGDIVLMLDDDFLMAPDYLRRTIELFEDDPSVVLATGTVLADGIHGPGYNHEQGRKMLAELNSGALPDTVTDTNSGYGCNFAIRYSVAVERGLDFDETLPLYSWLEDLDFSRRIAPFGKVVKSGAMRGVHLGTKTGRTPGMMLGYSQIANPLYLLRKGSITRRHAFNVMWRNTASNLFHSIHPPAWADFRGRLRGNLVAVVDVIRRRDAPGRILDLKK